MAAGSYTLYNRAKYYLNTGQIDLDAGNIRSKLYQSDSNASTSTLSTRSQVTNPVTGGGYKAASGGSYLLANYSVTTGASAGEYIFNSDDTVYTASGANITSIMYDVLYAGSGGGGLLLAWCKLSTAAFTVTSGNTLTNQVNASGYFTITSTP